MVSACFLQFKIDQELHHGLKSTSRFFYLQHSTSSVAAFSLSSEIFWYLTSGISSETFLTSFSKSLVSLLHKGQCFLSTQGSMGPYYTRDHVDRLLWLVCVLPTCFQGFRELVFVDSGDASYLLSIVAPSIWFHESFATSLLAVSHPFSPLWAFRTEWSLAWSSFFNQILYFQMNSFFYFTYRDWHLLLFFTNQNQHFCQGFIKWNDITNKRSYERWRYSICDRQPDSSQKSHLIFLPWFFFRFPLSPSLLWVLAWLLKSWSPHYGYLQL